MDNENGAVDTSINEEEVELTLDTEAEPNPAESVEELKAKLAKSEELAKNQKIRAEKAEQEAKKARGEGKPEPARSGDLSSKDIIAITRANVPDDDIDEVIEYAKFKKIDVADALKQDVLISILEKRAENRRVAEATNTGPARRGATAITAEELASQAATGKLPESDADIKKLLALKMGVKKV